MRPGEVVGGRFEIRALAGSGGTSVVYRALDRRTGVEVALKVHRTGRAPELGRFTAEARVLSTVEHPAIVRLVAHGATERGAPYLAMEWLDGEDLQRRLAGGAALSVEETLTLMVRVAEALAVAHAHRIVHRDIKPSNVFLVERAVARAKLLDFGIAHADEGALTRTLVEGTIGTPEYMSPEQARGAYDLDGRTDVFSLGCVAFECLTGKPAFTGSHMMALLSRVLIGDAPRVRDLRPDVPVAVDALVARMLSRDPSGRPADGAELVREIAAVEATAPELATPVVAAPVLTRGERRTFSVILAKVAVDADPGSEVAPTWTAAASSAAERSLGETIAAHGGAAERLADGTFIATFSAAAAATDHARAAARCALALLSATRGAAIALATGPGDLSARGAAGEVLERVVSLLRRARRPGGISAVLVDEVTAGLLDARFELGGDGDGLWLVSEREARDRARTVLGQVGPCVGRERELEMLHALFDECVSEPMAHAVLITGAPGVGKSRLGHEFLRGLARRHEGHEVWMGSGDPMSVASPFGLLGSALRQALGVAPGEPREVRERRLRSRIAARVGVSDRDRVADFMGELTGVHFPGDASAQLRAARRDAMLMGDQLRRAWEDLVAAECAEHPLVVVLEDLQWGDLPSVSLLDAALRIADRPLLVLGLARPEVSACFPRLWAGRAVTHVELDTLTRRASESLVRQLLGPRATEDVTRQIVERAAGNPFYLEEIVRSFAEGRGEAYPETVLAMVQARIERMSGDSRRLLRAASFFGQTFLRDGVLALTGDDLGAVPFDARVAELLREEMIVRQDEGTSPRREEFAFRHAIVREAAYATLTGEDRQLGHRLAAAWLERAGERDARILAEHFERGGEPARAAGFYLRAATQALEGNDLDGAIARAELGIRGAEGVTLGDLLLVQVEAHRWRGDVDAAERAAGRALEALPPRTAGWFAASSELAAGACRRGEIEVAERFTLALDPLADGASRRTQTVAAASVAIALLNAGAFAAATRLLAALGRVGGDLLRDDPAVDGCVQRALALHAAIGGDAAAFLERTEFAATCFDAAGYARNACLQRTNAGCARLELGSYVEAEQSLRAALLNAERCGLHGVAAATKHALGLALARLDRLAEAEAVEVEATEAFAAQANRRMEGGCRVYLSGILAQRGRLAEALAEARRAVALLERSPPALVCALGMVSEMELALGRRGDALAAASRAMTILDALGGVEEGETRARLAHATALKATGDDAGALAAIRVARDRLLERAARLRESAHRETLLGAVPENAKVLALADAWGPAP